MFKIFTFLFIFLLSGLSVLNAASLTVTHGINGLDINLDKELPVDISVNEECILKGVTFKQSATLDDLTQGEYLVKIHPSDDNCGLSPILERNIVINDKNIDGVFGAVASLGSDGTPTIALLNLGRFITPDITGLMVANLAKAENIFITAKIPPLISPVAKQRVRNGRIFGYASLEDSFDYNLRIFNKKRSKKAFISDRDKSVNLNRFVYVVGSRTNGYELIKLDF